MLVCIGFSNCKSDMESIDSSSTKLTLRDEEAQMIGVWQEYGNKAYQLDSLGNRIDSIDLNSIYEFKSDFTYTSQNDRITKATTGTWKIDSNIINNIYINLYPYYGSSPYLYREDVWEVSKLEEPYLTLNHGYNLVLLNKISWVSRKRTFIRIE